MNQNNNFHNQLIVLIIEVKTPKICRLLIHKYYLLFSVSYHYKIQATSSAHPSYLYSHVVGTKLDEM